MSGAKFSSVDGFAPASEVSGQLKRADELEAEAEDKNRRGYGDEARSLRREAKRARKSAQRARITALVEHVNRRVAERAGG